ncbi:hypothetical protein [Helicobacter sp. MIT 05-5294]|uniref:hypothetical protein n=1 Tax=Helicobacter sp. MIT 05-5294 TaxID=1548150 RepID=UPI0010FD423D|nr:hypothetical protein [Helicobacter sp. MIT 05-5294]TLD87831.1 hypothetical protein LS69_003290 [Helicobacter sp. MIT 05-5294]
MPNNSLKKTITSLLCFLLFALILSSCGSKYYFEPKAEEIKGKVSFSSSLPSPIVSILRDGATLKNGQFITKYSEIPDVYLPQNTQYLNQTEDYYLAGAYQTLLLIDKESNTQTSISFDNTPISASMNGALIAIIFDDNSFVLYDLNQGRVTYKQDSTLAPTNNTLIAAPYFLSDIVIVPTLDGKLVIVDKNNMQMIRNIVVNGDKYFNNVIFLEAIGNRMVAATPKRIISVSPNVISTFNANVKDILFFEDRIFIFTNEGEVILTDQDLNEKKRVKFPFAHFTAANHGRNIVILETQGYLIALDDELQSSAIFALPDAITSPTFSGMRQIFIGNRILKVE